jgi:hypothetical protein
MSTFNQIKDNLFSTPMPDMPPVLREMWQVAFMLRRKYSDPANKDPEAFFSSAWSDAQFIVQTYGNSETISALIAEVYLDIERQYKVVKAREDRS